MRCSWLIAALLVGCAGLAPDDPPLPLDATGTANLEMTRGDGCPMTGTEPFAFTLAQNDVGGYDLTNAATGETLSGDVTCTPDACDIQLFDQYTDQDATTHLMMAMLTLDAAHAITGTGMYSAVGTMLTCQQDLSFSGALE